jgi:hypothetical protein
MSLTAGPLAKAAHHLNDQAKRKLPFSITDIKTCYVNEYQGRRKITMFGVDPNSPIIRKMWPIISKLGLTRLWTYGLIWKRQNESESWLCEKSINQNILPFNTTHPRLKKV